MKAERRFLQGEVRAAGDGSARKIAGHVTKFDALSQVIYDFRERFAPGCFDACLANNPDIVGLFNHNMDYVLGRTSSGTMRASVDNIGLAYEIDPPNTTVANDLLVSLGRGDVRGSSIGFYCLEDDWDIDAATGMLIRTVLKAEVFDISVVTDPAYLTSDAAVRSQLPQNDQALRALAEEKRAALKPSAPQADEREMTSRLELLLHLAGR